MNAAAGPFASRGTPAAVVAAVVVVALGAWIALGAIDHGAAHQSFPAAFAMWNVMMVAMMLPSALPWLAILSTARPGAAGPDVVRFATGYFAVWAGYCLAAAWAQTALNGGLTGPGNQALPAWPAAGVLIGAGLFQFSPLKAACLRHCRSPLGFLLTHWSEKPGWTLRVGAAHGLYCVGCCWALMAVVFAVGVMNLVWMAALTLLLCLEQWLPGGTRMARWTGAGLMAAGALRLAIG